MKILVIEDQPAELKLAQDVLQAAGHDVSGASTADEAYELIASDRPEVILLDLYMPGTDGLTLVRQLKRAPETADIHIVTMTSYTETFSRTATLAAGSSAYLLKPLNTRTLSDDIQAAVNGKPAAPLA